MVCGLKNKRVREKQKVKADGGLLRWKWAGVVRKNEFTVPIK